jgi:hypothetical protein
MFVRRILVLGLCVGVFGCARDARLDGAEAASAAQAAALPAQGAVVASSSSRQVQGFASLPDRGELVAYRKDNVRARGAYTWYRADVSEAHALAAIANGHLRVNTPDGKLLDFQYDRHVEHASGDWTWIGHLAGNKAVQTVLTFGAKAAFGSIGQPDQRPLRMTVRDGHSWLVATDAAKLAKVAGRYTSEPDYLIVPAPGRRDGHGQRGRASAGALVARPQAANAASTTVDVLVGYSPGFVTAYGSQSAAMTRLNYLVDFTNQAYANSEDSTAQLGVIRLVGSMQVNYADNTDNGDTLHKLSGYDADLGKEITPDPAFNALRAARETLGADLVSFVHDFRTPENDSCGVAWLLGGGKQGIGPNDGWDYLGYSVVSDGSDVDEGDSGSYYCEDHTFAHELGHNMGLAHDRETSKGGDDTLDNPGDYGVSDYSFGYKRTSVNGGLYTIMAYGDDGQVSYPIFSNPRKTSCGGQACGIAKGQPDAADASLSLSETMPLIAAFRAAVSLPANNARADFNGDGRSDVFWRNADSGYNTIWLSGNSSTGQAVSGVGGSWQAAGVGDFDGDGRADVFWRNPGSGANVIWKAASSSNTLAVKQLIGAAWRVAGVADFNGDGRDDILWRNADIGYNTIWLSANSSTGQAVAGVGTSWQIAGVGDFDGDGRADILWRSPGTGSNVIWKAGNSASQQAVTRLAGAAWQVAAVADFNADGRADIFWRNADIGYNTIWLSGSSSTGQAVSGVGPSWTVAGVADYDGNGRADIFWRSPGTGSNVIWKGANSSTTQAVKQLIGAGWQVVD